MLRWGKGSVVHTWTGASGEPNTPRRNLRSDFLFLQEDEEEEEETEGALTSDPFIHWPHLPSPHVESWSSLSVLSSPSFSGERVSAGLRLPDLAMMSYATRHMVLPATPLHVIATQPVLIPSVLNGRHVSCKHQHKRWQRTQLIDSIILVVPDFLPLHQIYDHHAHVEAVLPHRSFCLQINNIKKKILSDTLLL